ncbi:unnamed protein product [Vicia faba]|uniref:Uncharacterized protein n=1 Tax=Vicia faba TaxID=3906 RepID=A0AAV1ALI5_VICFA|nr:unnamed protein product [Vicia faba]
MEIGTEAPKRAYFGSDSRIIGTDTIHNDKFAEIGVEFIISRYAHQVFASSHINKTNLAFRFLILLPPSLPATTFLGRSLTCTPRSRGLVECIMAMLIFKNLVKGYFAHKSKVAVLSKQDPFPKLNGKPVSS